MAGLRDGKKYSAVHIRVSNTHARITSLILKASLGGFPCLF